MIFEKLQGYRSVDGLFTLVSQIHRNPGIGLKFLKLNAGSLIQKHSIIEEKEESNGFIVEGKPFNGTVADILCLHVSMMI